MNKFTKVKKALAVSLCSSMLFSGAHKTSGMMDDEKIRLLSDVSITNDEKIKSQLSEIISIIKEPEKTNFWGDRFTSLLDWTLGSVAVALLGYLLVNVGVNFSKALTINENINISDKLLKEVVNLVESLKKANENSAESNITANDESKNFHDTFAYLDLGKEFLSELKENQIIKGFEGNNLIIKLFSCCKKSKKSVLFRLSKARSMANDSEICKEEVIKNIAKALEIVTLLKTKFQSKSKDLLYNKEDFSELFDKLEVFLDSVKDSKKPEVNMRCALKCTKEIFKKAGIPIDEGELVI